MLHFGHAYKKINNTVIDNAEDLDIIILMYNLLEYNDKCSMISGSLWKYYRNEIKVSAIYNNNYGNKINNNKTLTSKSFEYEKYKTKIMGRTSDDTNTLNAEVVVSLKYLSNFWRFPDFPLKSA